jgi:hypothetical protein
MRRYRILSDGERFKVQIEKWFIIWHWVTLTEKTVCIDGCGESENDITFGKIEEAQKYLKRLDVEWTTVETGCLQRGGCF